ncbi:MAG: hypothetical protein Q7K35_01560 [bacterium]|nr:hypothetical protein [bacterium]
MLDYLKKFNDLPAEVKQKVSNPEAMATIEKLEKKYRLPLAAFIMKVMAREIALADLARFLIKEGLAETPSKQLAEELKEKLFVSLKDYFPLPVRQAGPSDYLPVVQPSRPIEPAQKIAPLPKAAARFDASEKMERAAEPSSQPAVKGASFFFSPDDEREIRELAKKIDLAQKTELPAEKIEVKLKAIFNRAQINFGSVDLADRFKQILKTYLRGIRNKLETELTLIKPFSSGGLSFDDNSARKVMTIAEKVLNSESVLFIEQDSLLDSQIERTFKAPAKIKIPELEKIKEEKITIVRDAPYDFSKLAREKKPYDRPEREALSHELAPLTLAIISAKPKTESLLKANKPIAAKAEKQAPKEEPSLPVRPAENSAKPTKQLGADSQLPLIRRRFEAENLNQSQKVKVEDVKYIPRVMSPLDEIRYLNLINFRRLDKDPLKGIDKIKSKINLLEEEGYSKRLEGIKFWRLSPLNKLYLEIGHLSIGENKPVDVIIEERKIKNLDYLTEAEFQAVMDLNKSLRF